MKIKLISVIFLLQSAISAILVSHAIFLSSLTHSFFIINHTLNIILKNTFIYLDKISENLRIVLCDIVNVCFDDYDYIYSKSWLVFS